MIEDCTRGTARGEIVTAFDAREVLEDEVLELRVVGRHVETCIAVATLEPDLERVGFFERHGRVADLKRSRRIVRTLVEQLNRIRGTLDMLCRHVGNHFMRQVAASRSGAGTLAMKGIEMGAAALIVVVGLLLLTGYMSSEQLWMFSA